MPDRTEQVVAERIATELLDWCAGADPGEQSPYATVAVLDSAGRRLVGVDLTYRQAAELAAWQAGVPATACTPPALADILGRWIDPVPAVAAATVVFTAPDGSDSYPVRLARTTPTGSSPHSTSASTTGASAPP